MDGYNIRAVIADDHPVIRMGLEMELDRVSGIRVVGSTCNSTELVELLSNVACDVVITDYAMPGGAHGDGLELLGYIRQKFASIAIVVLTGIDRPALIRTLRARGIANIVSKTDATLHVSPAIKAAATGRCYHSPAIAGMLSGWRDIDAPRHLSPREMEVMSLFVRGMSITEIAGRLQRTKQTVSAQKISAMCKLGVQSEAELVAHMAETGLFTDMGHSGQTTPTST